MKKILVLLLVISVFALIFSSCQGAPPPDTGNESGGENSGGENSNGSNQSGESQNAEEFLETVEEKMETLVSHKEEMSTRLKYYIRGYEVQATGTGLYIEIDTEDEYYYYQSMSMEGGSEELSLDIDVTTINAYNDGKAFLYNVGGDVDQRFCSDMTKKKFIGYLDDITEISEDDIDLIDCTKKELVENEDGTWTVMLSGYTKRTMNKLFGQNGLDEISFGVDIVDMEIVINVNSDLLITEQTFTAIFAEPEIASMVHEYVLSVEYSEYNEATPVTENLDVSDYDEIGDVSLLVNIEKMIEERQEDESGRFSISIDQEFEKPALSSALVWKELYSVDYGTNDGKYVYNMDGSINDTDVTVEYCDGTKKTTRLKIVQTVPQSELEARQYINGLINYAGYDRQNVVSITEISNGVYEIVMKPQAGKYQQLYANNNGTYKSATETMTVTIKDDKITKIEFEVKARGEYTYNNISSDMPMTIITEIKFAD